MRQLTEEEESKVFKRLEVYIGDAIKDLMENKVLMYNNQKVLLMNQKLLKAVSQISRKKLICAGVIIGKFTKSQHFRITITALNTLHIYALHKVWIKYSAEMNYLYGNKALKSHIYKISENIPINSGVFVYNQNNTLLGFGIITVSSTSYARARGGNPVLVNQADNGEYIRNETAIA